MQVLMDEDIAAGKLPEGSRIEPWDWFYYASKVRNLKYSLDESLTKPYFSVDSVYKGVFFAAKTLYGVNVEPAPEVEVYNPAVKAYKVTDADGTFLGIFYQDPFSRSTKRGGAWMNNFRDQHLDAAGNDVLTGLKNADVGAIYLGSASTNFHLKDDNNNLGGMIRQTGIFLRESGGVGTVQHVDLAV